MRRWRRLRCYVETAKALCLLLLTLIMTILDEARKNARVVCFIVSVFLIWWVYSNLDPCRGKKIASKLCDDYYHGDISGRLCPLLCREKSIYLWTCTEDEDQKSFWWDNLIMRVPRQLEQGQEVTLAEGMLPSQFMAHLLDFLRLQLGPGDFHQLARELEKFADFNEDGRLSLGEAQSLWRLIHNHEFLVMFVFKDSYSFPALNGSCGSVFGFHYPAVSAIYDKDVFPLHILSSNAYRWFLPSWERRAKVAVGVLDLMFDLYEEKHVKFYMCDVRPTSIGHSRGYEAVVSDGRSIRSGAMLARGLENTSCSHDHQCRVSRYCSTMCDIGAHRCTGEVTKPTLWQACHLLEDYLAFDAPPKLRGLLGRLLDRCSHLIVYGQSIDMSHVVLVADLKTILWDHIKNKDVR